MNAMVDHIAEILAEGLCIGSFGLFIVIDSLVRKIQTAERGNIIDCIMLLIFVQQFPHTVKQLLRRLCHMGIDGRILMQDL